MLCKLVPVVEFPIQMSAFVNYKFQKVSKRVPDIKFSCFTFLYSFGLYTFGSIQFWIVHFWIVQIWSCTDLALYRCGLYRFKCTDLDYTDRSVHPNLYNPKLYTSICTLGIGHWAFRNPHWIYLTQIYAQRESEAGKILHTAAVGWSAESGTPTRPHTYIYSSCSGEKLKVPESWNLSLPGYRCLTPNRVSKNRLFTITAWNCFKLE